MLLSVFIFLGTGCGGLAASHSISPASFFLPGLIQNKSDTNSAQPLASTFKGQTQTAGQSL
jgi:hypothetical protein